MKEEVEKIQTPGKQKEPKFNLHEFQEQILASVEQNTTDVRKEMQYLRNQSLDPKTFQMNIDALKNQTSQFHSTLEKIQEDVSPNPDIQPNSNN